jgi:hypothetical protein
MSGGRVSATTSSPHSTSGNPGSGISALATSLLAPAALAGVLYGLARQGYVEFYRVLGLTPEQVGLSQVQIVAQVGVMLGSYILILLSVIWVGIFAYRVTIAASGHSVPTSTSRKTTLITLAVVLTPLIIFGTVAWILPQGTWLSRAGRAVVLILAAVAWIGLIRPSPSLPTSRRYRIIVVMTLLTGLAVASILTRDPLQQYLWYGFLASALLFGLFAAYYYEGPSGPQLRFWLTLWLPIVGIMLATGATRGSLQTWLTMAAPAYVAGVGLAQLGVNRGVLTPFLDRLFPSGAPQITGTVVFLLAAALSLGFMLNFWRDAREDGEALLRGTPPKKALFEVLSYQVFPVRLLQVGTDTFDICHNTHEFYLLGRDNDRSYIISLRRDRSINGDVLSIPLDDYVPVTGIEDPGACAKITVAPDKSKP